MVDTTAHLCGQLAIWPSKGKMVKILRSAGLRVHIGRYSIRVEDCSHFVFQEYGGDLGDPTIDADADSPLEMTREARLVSDALAKHALVVHNEYLNRRFHRHLPRSE